MSNSYYEYETMTTDSYDHYGGTGTYYTYRNREPADWCTGYGYRDLEPARAIYPGDYTGFKDDYDHWYYKGELMFTRFISNDNRYYFFGEGKLEDVKVDRNDNSRAWEARLDGKFIFSASTNDKVFMNLVETWDGGIDG